MTSVSDALHVAIDLGAGSGRTLVGGVGPRGLRVLTAHRFHYQPRRLAGHLRWDAGRLIEGIRTGLARARDLAAELGAPLASVGVDSWGVDYALVDADGSLIEDPVCYRDERTEDAVEEVFGIVPRAELYRRTGIQFRNFNTLYQLRAHLREGMPARASHLLLIPDFCHHVLCGSLLSERTNASTTQLLNARTNGWDDEMFLRLGLPRHLMPNVVTAGTSLGRLRPALCRELGITPLAVLAPGTHDTASAVAGTPLAPDWAYISSGTWSLVGVERQAPLLTTEAANADLTNEAGVFGRVRLLANVMGMWLLESCRREWEAEGRGQDLEVLLDRLAGSPEPVGVIFPDDQRFFAPVSMVRAIRSMLVETGQPDTDDPVRLTKVILDSLALRYAAVVATIERLTGEAIPGIHIVGGGSRNRYLNAATADAAARPVVAGPAEATAIGNLLVQAIAAGTITSLENGRRLIARALPPERFEPGHPERWDRVYHLYRDLAAR